jgi:hypothetical protein
MSLSYAESYPRRPASSASPPKRVNILLPRIPSSLHCLKASHSPACRTSGQWCSKAVECSRYGELFLAGLHPWSEGQRAHPLRRQDRHSGESERGCLHQDGGHHTLRAGDVRALSVAFESGRLGLHGDRTAEADAVFFHWTNILFEAFAELEQAFLLDSSKRNTC